jgi:hypothetical protein
MLPGRSATGRSLRIQFLVYDVFADYVSAMITESGVDLRSFQASANNRIPETYTYISDEKGLTLVTRVLENGPRYDHYNY